MSEIIEKAKELLTSGKVDRVVGWECGEFVYDVSPAVFASVEDIEKRFYYGPFSGANLSKYLIDECRKGGKVGVFLKPCDAYSFAQLLKEHRINREQVYAVAIECYGKVDIEKIRDKVNGAITSVRENADGTVTVTALGGEKTLPIYEVLIGKCEACKSKAHPVYDEIIGEEGTKVEDCNRFDLVEKLEKMTPEERFEFWRGELSRCIRCNACRNVCPACTCEKCVFDNPDSGIAQKAAADTFEENNFHIIRAFHVAGRCTDCGECSRVCPQHIPLHLLNRKFIKDINELYGEYQAGEKEDERFPLTNYTKGDCEPSVVYDRGGDK